jgi:2-haloacid dehalogenase
MSRTLNVRFGRDLKVSGNLTRGNSRIRAIIFDAYGTLFDTSSVRSALEIAFPGKGDYLTQVWRLKQLEYSWLRALSGDYRHFGCVTRDALQFSLKTVGIIVTSAHLESLVEAYDHLTLFPDAIRLLDALSGWRLSIFSNGSPAMLEALLFNAGIIDRFESVISVDEVRTYKPHPRTYRLACNRLNLAPEEILLVSSNGFDLHGGSQSGLRTARIERLSSEALADALAVPSPGSSAMFMALRSQLENLSAEPDTTVPTLFDLVEAIYRL